jgi:hypothetical protein
MEDVQVRSINVDLKERHVAQFCRLLSLTEECSTKTHSIHLTKFRENRLLKAEFSKLIRTSLS